MFSVDDTIVARATPAGRGGLAVVRLSGPQALSIARRLIVGASELEPRHATLVRVAGTPQPGSTPAGRTQAVDEAVATRFAAPASYTGEEVVEFSVHGSPVVVAELVGAAIAAGARLAQPGEFTLRAFLNGRLDLTRAEAVRDLVDATSPIQARLALDQLDGTLAERLGEIEAILYDLTARLEASADFPEEGYHFITPEETLRAIRAALARMDGLLAESARGRLLREGVTVAIAGRPNVGKSTLFNRLAGVERAIVTEVPGTTRDLLTEAVVLHGARMTLVDTAGVRAATDAIEREGVARAEKAIAAADVVLVVFDASQALDDGDHRLLERTAGRTRLVVANKFDKTAAWDLDQLRSGRGGDLVMSGPERTVLAVSASTGAGVDELVRSIARVVGLGGLEELPHISNIRQIDLLGRSTETVRSLEVALSGSGAGLPEELVLADVRTAVEFLQEVTGKRTTDDLLETIFSSFCIGK